MRREANFSNTITEILTKKRREEREMMGWKWEKKMNFGDVAVKIGEKKFKEKKNNEFW